MKALALHLALIAALLAVQFVLPPYHYTNVARVMVLAVSAMGYNIAFGSSGVLSLGAALFFAAGMYATGLAVQGAPALLALPLGMLAGAAMALAVGLLALRTAGVAFMIVTLMFAQAGYLTILYYGPVTGGDEGFVLAREARMLTALVIFGVALLANLALVRSGFGRVMVAMRENEERSRMLGYDPFRTKLIALTLSGLYSGTAGAAYALMFGYVGASFAAIQYSILPLLWVLLGGAGTVLGPFVGALLMFYLIDLSSSVTDASNLVVGVALLVLVLFAPKGILGTIRERGARWLP